MAFITAFVDIRDANGVSLVPQNADGTTPVKILQIGAGLIGTYAKSGDLGIVTIAPDPAALAVALAGVDLELTSLLVDGDTQTSTLEVTTDASIGNRITFLHNSGSIPTPATGSALLGVTNGTDAFVRFDDGSIVHIAKKTPPSVTGSKASGAALVSLLSVLATAGIIIDGTSA